MTDEYYCTNCGATLNDQCGFDPDEGTWTCTICGTHLMDDDVYEGVLYEGVAWYCDQCGALLNRQSGFQDYCGTWACTECGYLNPISQDAIYNSPNDKQLEDAAKGIGFLIGIIVGAIGLIADIIKKKKTLNNIPP